MNRNKIILLVVIGAIAVCAVVFGVYFKVISEVLVEMVLGIFS